MPDFIPTPNFASPPTCSPLPRLSAAGALSQPWGDPWGRQCGVFGVPTSPQPAEPGLCLPHSLLAARPTALCRLPAPSSLWGGWDTGDSQSPLPGWSRVPCWG